jgi:hypothetical protein
VRCPTNLAAPLCCTRSASMNVDELCSAPTYIQVRPAYDAVMG